MTMTAQRHCLHVSSKDNVHAKVYYPEHGLVVEEGSLERDSEGCEEGKG